MRTVEKVALVAAVREEHALTPVLAALGLPRATWYYQQQRVSYAEKYAYLRGPLETIARKHPGYGIPRITTELQETYDQAVNHKVYSLRIRNYVPISSASCTNSDYRAK